MKYKRPYISVEFQHGPIKEVGENGTQLINVLQLALDELNRVDAGFTCRENALTRTKLEEAIHWQEHRTRDRESRGVEGFQKP